MGDAGICRTLQDLIHIFVELFEVEMAMGICEYQNVVCFTSGLKNFYE